MWESLREGKALPHASETCPLVCSPGVAQKVSHTAHQKEAANGQQIHLLNKRVSYRNNSLF